MNKDVQVVVWDGDNESSSRILRALGRIDGYQILEFRSGSGGIENLYALRPQILLLDLDYTIADVGSIVRNIKQRLPKIYIIGLTRQLDDAGRRRFASFGVDDVQHKSIDGRQFLIAVQKHSLVKDEGDSIAFFSPKGKSGRTTLIVNLAMSLARISNAKVGIIDADTNFADLDAFLNLSPRSTIVEALRDLPYMTPGALVRYFEGVNEQVSVLCGAKSPEEAAYIEPDGLANLIAAAKREFKYCLVDLPPGFTLVSIAAAEASDYTYLTAMACGGFEKLPLKRSMEIFRSLKGGWKGRVSAVITRMERSAQQQAAMQEAIGCPVTLLPNEYLLCAAAANNGRMAVDFDADSPLTAEIDRMAQAICNRKTKNA